MFTGELCVPRAETTSYCCLVAVPTLHFASFLPNKEGTKARAQVES